MRKTKIICTLGPASESEETIEKLCLAGMNVARFNFSHGTHEWHKTVMDRVKRVREKLDIPVAIMLDTKGPEYRIGTIPGGPVELRDGDPFTFTVDDIEGDASRVSVSYKTLCSELVPGDLIYVNDGLVQFSVEEISGPVNSDSITLPPKRASISSAIARISRCASGRPTATSFAISSILSGSRQRGKFSSISPPTMRKSSAPRYCFLKCETVSTV